MASGGARNRSGPPKDPNSERSDRAGVLFQALPARGFDGPVPVFPLPGATGREAEVWESVWRTPQAWAWAQPGMEWLHRTVAMWVRVSVRCEDAEAGPTLLAQVHRFADQIGMTTAGLQALGWTIARDELAERRSGRPESVGAERPVRRMRSVDAG